MYEKTNSGSATVPVWIDSVKKDPKFPMTRLRYLVLEARDPLPGRGVPDMPGDLPLLVSRLSAVVQGPDRDRMRFKSADDLTELFARVRKDGQFSLSFPSLWLPNTIFPSKPPVRRGAVYRLTQDLFRAGLMFRSGLISQQQLASATSSRPVFSPDETAALAAWSKRQIELAKDSYKRRKDVGKYLHWKGEIVNESPRSGRSGSR
jgi:hypothetical protein